MANQERIDSIIDEEAISRQISNVERKLKGLEDVIKNYPTIKAGIEGANGIKELSQQQTKLVENNKQVVISQEKVNDAFAALKSVSGTLEQNIKTQVRFKAELKETQEELKKLKKAAEGTATTKDDVSPRIIELTKREAELKAAVSESNAAIKLQVKEANAAGGSYDELSSRLSQMKKAFAQLSDAERDAETGQFLVAGIKATNDALKSLDEQQGIYTRNVGNYEGSAKIIVDSLEKEIQKLKELESQRVRVANAGAAPIGFAAHSNQAATITSKAGGDFSGYKLGASAATKELQELDQQIEKSRVVIQGFRRVTEQPQFLKMAGSFGDATKEIRYFTKVLDDMERKGQKNSVAYVELRAHLARLTDEIGDTRAEIKALSSDTRGLDLFAGSVSFAADAMQTAAGAAVLFGASEEEVAEQTRTLVAIQSVANGIKGIGNELTTRGTAANKLYTFSQKQLSIAFDSSAKAGARFKAALISTGFGAIIVGLGLLIANFDKIKRSITGVTKAQEQLNETTKDYAEGAKGAIENVNKVSIAFDQAKRGVITKNEALKIYNETLGDSLGHTNSLATAEKNLLDKADAYIKITALKAQANAIFAKSAEATTKGLTAQLEDQTNFADKSIFYFKQLLGKNSGALKSAAEAQAEGIAEAKKESEKLAVDLNKIGEDLLKQAEELQKKFKITDPDIGKDRAEAAKKAAEEAKKAAEERLKESVEAEKRNNEAIRQLAIANAQEKIRIAQNVLDTETSLLKDQLAAAATIRQQTNLIAAINYQKEVEDVKTVEDGKIKIIKKSQDEILLATKTNEIAITQATEQAINNRKVAYTNYYNKIKQAADDAKDSVIKSLEIENTKGQNDASGNRNSAIAMLAKQYEEGKVSKRKYEEERLRIEQEYQMKSLALEIQHQKDLIRVSFLNDEEKAEALKKLSDLEVQYAELSLNIHTANEQKKREQFERTVDKMAEVQDAVLGLLQTGFDREVALLEERQRLLDEDTARRINNINMLGLSEAERIRQIAVVEKNAMAQTEQIEKRKRALAAQRAKFEKAANISSIIMSTAKAVIATLAENPPPRGIPLAIAVAATGALQLARAIAAPIPKYKTGRGKGKDEIAWTGDGGVREPILRGDGTIDLSPAKPTLTWLNRDDQVFPNINALMMAMANKQIRNMPKMETQKQNLDPEARRLLRGINQHLKELNSKSRISIHNHHAIETTAWYQKNFKN